MLQHFILGSGGKWKDKQMIREDLVKLALSSAIPADMPLTLAKDAQMLRGQRTIGGSKNITRVGGSFSASVV